MNARIADQHGFVLILVMLALVALTALAVTGYMDAWLELRHRVNKT